MPDTGRPLSRYAVAGKDMELYQPVSINEPGGNHYVVMKTSDTPAAVPPLSEMRDEVVKAWKLQKAAELAEKNAQELAKKAEEASRR